MNVHVFLGHLFFMDVGLTLGRNFNYQMEIPKVLALTSTVCRNYPSGSIMKVIQDFPGLGSHNTIAIFTG